MKLQSITLVGLLTLLVLVSKSNVQANPLIWNGPVFSYSQPAPDPTQATNQDRLTSDVWITRSATRGLFNAAKESGFASFFSPQNTTWSYGTLSNYATLSYTNWEAFNGKNPPSMIGQDAVLHLVSDDIYLSVKFTSWGINSPGFSYDRSTPVVVPEPSAYALFFLGGLILMLLARKRRSSVN